MVGMAKDQDIMVAKAITASDSTTGAAGRGNKMSPSTQTRSSSPLCNSYLLEYHAPKTCRFTCTQCPTLVQKTLMSRRDGDVGALCTVSVL